jgi:hypothetical protein
MIAFKPIAGTSIIGLSHPRFDVGACQLWLPEAVSTQRGYALVYPRGMEWRRDGATLTQQGAADHAFGPGNFPEVAPGVLECAGIRSVKERPLDWQARCRFGDDRLDYSLTVSNPHEMTLAKVAAEVCFKFLDGSWWSDDQCHFLTVEGPRTIAQLGRSAGQHSSFQAWLMAGESYDHPFVREFWGYGAARAASPVWVSRCQRANCSVVVGCEAAYFIHSNAGNPCTDLALKSGDLPPGGTATCSGYVEFTSRSVADLLAELERAASSPRGWGSNGGLSA